MLVSMWPFGTLLTAVWERVVSPPEASGCPRQQTLQCPLNRCLQGLSMGVMLMSSRVGRKSSRGQLVRGFDPEP